MSIKVPFITTTESERQQRREQERHDYQQAHVDQMAARQRADEAERARVDAAHRAMHAPPEVKADPNSGETKALRAQEMQRLSEARKERERAFESFRGQLVNELGALRNATAAAVAAHDLEAYVAAHGRHTAIAEMLKRLVADEQTRQQIAATPIMYGAERV